jgi:surfeit locus 1 family protein
MSPSSRNWPVLLASATCVAILLWLGTWQVSRLSEKTAQIAAIDARIVAEPVSLPERIPDGQNSEYLKVRVEGAYIPATNLKKLTSVNGGPGYEIITPFLTTDKTVILVDRGSIAESQSVTSPQGPQTLTGLLRLHNKGQGFFDPENDTEKGLWYWWDIPAMQAAANAPTDAKFSPYMLQLLPDPNLATPPFPAVPKAELRNNHLGYAITWYGLAAALIAVARIFLRNRKAVEAAGAKR